MISRVHLIILTCIIIASCNRASNDLYEVNTGEKTKKFYLTDKTGCYSFCVRYFETNNREKFFILQNDDFNRIEFYHWETGKFSHMIELEKRGPSGVGSLRGFEVISLDSILVFNAMTNNGIFYMVNKKGHIIRTFNIESSNIMYPFVPLRPTSTMNNSIHFKNDSIAILPSFFFMRLEDNEDIKDSKLLAELNIFSGENKLLPLSYPVLWNSHKQPVISYGFSSTFDGENYVFSFGMSHDIYYSKDFFTLEKIFAGSKYIEDDFLSNSTEHKFNMGKYPSPVYKSVYYDENHEVYYRFVNHGFIQKARDIKSNARYPQNTSVIILNKDFEIIGETKLPPDKYVINMTFQSKEGIYISTSNPYSPTINEDLMEFELLTINELK